MSSERKELPARANRGARMSKLLNSEQGVEEEDEFWNSEYWKEEKDDKEYNIDEEKQEEDIVDADFDDPEAEIVEPISEQDEETDDQTKKVPFQILQKFQ